MSKVVDSQCAAFQRAIDVLGRPWNALILNTLQVGRLHFCELVQATRGPSDKMLSTRLKELEAQGLLSRHVDPGPPVRVSYELTDCGREFNAVAKAIEKWGHRLVTKTRWPGYSTSRQ